MTLGLVELTDLFGKGFEVATIAQQTMQKQNGRRTIAIAIAINTNGLGMQQACRIIPRSINTTIDTRMFEC
jgi:hypothetical protein